MWSLGCILGEMLLGNFESLEFTLSYIFFKLGFTDLFITVMFI